MNDDVNVLIQICVLRYFIDQLGGGKTSKFCLILFPTDLRIISGRVAASNSNYSIVFKKQKKIRYPGGARTKRLMR